eukprot:7098270-Karenia_brevis.AAC.1
MRSDHRAIFIKFQIDACSKGQWRKGRDFANKPGIGWAPSDTDLYKRILDDKLAEARFPEQLRTVDEEMQMMESL